MVTLRELVQVLRARPWGQLDQPVSDITHDSRQSTPGSLFVAVSGARFDGHDFVPQAVERGATAVLSQKPRPPAFDRTWLQVEDVRLALALASASIFGHPSHRLKLVGITGTNGKTTTAHLIDSVFKASGRSSAMMGTIVYRQCGEERPADRTTPEAPDVQRFLHQASARGATHAVMEVSSQALDLKRVHGTEFAVAAFTNLTPEHLDYHHTMDAYFAAKRQLFEGLAAAPPKGAVINRDDPRAEALLALSRSCSSQVLTYGIEAPADVRAVSFWPSMDGLRLAARTPLGRLSIRSPLFGKPHVYNILAALSVGLLLGLDGEAIARGINLCPPVPGRFEIVNEGQDFAVVVDYAHTRDALKNVIETARVLTPYRIITLFGCGGDRDFAKRAPMGRVAAELSELVIVTSDNPRREDPEAIIGDIEVGLRQAAASYLRIVDRRDAIRRAIQEARPGDLVLIAGKGHETCQIFKDRSIPFDDREQARAAIRERLGTARSRPPARGGPSLDLAAEPSYAETGLKA